MRSFKFVIPCALALFGAAPAISAPVAIAKEKLACTYLSDHERLMNLLGDIPTWWNFRVKLLAAKRCFDLPPGTEVFWENKEIGISTCIRPRGQIDCVWTLIEDMERRALIRADLTR